MEETRTVNSGVGDEGSVVSDLNERIATLELEVVNLAERLTNHGI